ncbi:hypothetical protein HYE02_00860 [Mycoplasmopsis bovis]|nr:hypothetical protein [Mycoplasmopsis bovis]QQH28219.1 hypothetical protein HYE02_00860 [Mycoplasmopsis bovis]
MKFNISKNSNFKLPSNINKAKVSFLLYWEQENKQLQNNRALELTMPDLYVFRSVSGAIFIESKHRKVLGDTM